MTRIEETDVVSMSNAWPRLVQTVGFPIAACVALGWVYNSTISWERDKMLPALEATAKSIDTNSEVLRSVNLSIQKLPASLQAERQHELETEHRLP